MRDLRIRWFRAGPGCAVLACVLSLSWAPSAHAHPFGDPQTLEVSADGSTVRARWRAAGDDLTALALELRVLRQKRTYVYRDGALVPEESDESDAVTLAKSPEFGAYLVRGIQVSAAGQACPGRLVKAADLARDGALLEFACARPVTDAQVTVRTLTDLHPSYRTLASASGGERHTYSNASPTHTWSLDGSAARAQNGALLQLGIPIAVVAAAAGGFVWFRRRRSAS